MSIGLTPATNRMSSAILYCRLGDNSPQPLVQMTGKLTVSPDPQKDERRQTIQNKASAGTNLKNPSKQVCQGPKLLIRHKTKYLQMAE
jgi:hypothetical protein